jgi:hypothetical protein
MKDSLKTKKQLLKALEQEREQSIVLMEETGKRELELAALLAASRSVSEFRSFREAARAIFDIAKELVEASSGYIALLSEDGEENEVLFLDAGGLPCTAGCAAMSITPARWHTRILSRTALGRSSCPRATLHWKTLCSPRLSSRIRSWASWAWPTKQGVL